MCFFVLAQTLDHEILYENTTICKDKNLDGWHPSGIRRGYDLSNLSYSRFQTNLLFKAAFCSYLLMISFVSTSATVYATAGFFIHKEVTFNKAVTSAFPKVWKRLLINFFCVCIAYLLYALLIIVVFICWGMFLNTSTELKAAIGTPGTMALMALFLVGFVYMKVVWQLADVVAVLQDVRGFQAMKKSRALIKGKMSMAIATYFNYKITNYIVEFAFWKTFVNEWYFGNLEGTGYGILGFLLLFLLSSFGRVVETIFYFVCKSYSQETTMDMTVLADDDQLQVYLLGDQLKDVPLKAAEDV
ncbi:hypothetical protein FNV43_RR18392 [Rhamnella rubrinervis]|uniref:Uncharacterized protein n=1 Tax=Rhamnella rubrinervis TaxID=2594499 RepID=A0A8K0E5R6_9ROSA|nr:hypothetical protein FNV43_RR18392 [Rhamnella rubrinervis]